jgi:signal transduction histidine kinase
VRTETAWRSPLEEFTSIVSHDLRSPLTVADGYVKLAQETCESEHLARATDAIDRCQALIDDLLTLARFRENTDRDTDTDDNECQDVFKPEPVELPTVAESCRQTVETADATLEVDLEVGSDADRGGDPRMNRAHTVSADESRLRQLFENLYRNAIEHGGECVAVSIGLTEHESGFYVVDTGSGIPESAGEEIFGSGALDYRGRNRSSANRHASHRGASVGDFRDRYRHRAWVGCGSIRNH